MDFGDDVNGRLIVQLPPSNITPQIQAILDKHEKAKRGGDALTSVSEASLAPLLLSNPITPLLQEEKRKIIALFMPVSEYYDNIASSRGVSELSLFGHSTQHSR